jgi:PPOX class probable F420-dependent enzyme
MGKQRDAIRMSEAEIVAFLDECKSLQVATLDASGAPHLTTVWFAVQGGAFLFETYGKSQKVVNLRRDPRIAVLCEKGENYDQLRGVSVQGTAEIVEGGERLLELMQVIVDRNHPGMTADQVAEIATNMAKKRVVVVVKPDKVISWDHRKLAR